ncbi:YidC/Oxa1 family membrane protein insertase [Actinoplanes sp. NPDC051343]|uniref:YidC/Oxa1 family membrane protein insertase n=1 Tax=Actinoplanes sp. NPDC051343 TaxID=3363906 RepID=UPI00378F7907
MSIFSAFNAVVGVAHSAIEGLASLLGPLAGSLSVALAIVLFTLLVRLSISPLTYLQIRSGRRRETLAVSLAALREKHAGDPSTLATETLALHRANGISPFAGLLPGLIQWPFFMVMYRVAYRAPAGDLFGVPLSAHLAAGLPVFAVLVVIAAVVAWVSSRRLTSFLRFLPFLTVLTVAWLPLAGALYLVTSTTWTAFEQAFWRRPVLTGNS